MQLGRALTPAEAKSGQFKPDQVIRYGNGLYLKPTPPPNLSAPTTTLDNPETPDSITKSFLDQVKGYLQPGANQPSVTPFDKSGFYSEGDTRSLADQEYNPYYDALKAYQGGQNAETDRQRLEQVNASGGTRSSAYATEQDLRKQALQQAGTQMSDQEKAAKEGFVQNRRQDAYTRYLQSIGSLAT